MMHDAWEGLNQQRLLCMSAVFIWAFGAILEFGIQDITQTTPEMHILTMCARNLCFQKKINWSKHTSCGTCHVIVMVSGIVNCHWPEVCAGCCQSANGHMHE